MGTDTGEGQDQNSKGKEIYQTLLPEINFFDILPPSVL
jgi:hypothetical protein